MTYKQAQQRYGIQGRSTFLSGYVNMAGLTGVLDFLTCEEETACDSDNYPAHTRAKNRELEAQLELANQKAEFFESVSMSLKMITG